MLTDFGLGMCGALVGGLIGIALAMVLDTSWPIESRLGLWPIGTGGAAAWFASWLAKRLIRPARRSFERLMLSFVIATIPTTFVTLVLRNPYVLAAGVCIGSLAVYSYLRSLPPDWGLEQDRGPDGHS